MLDFHNTYMYYVLSPPPREIRAGGFEHRILPHLGEFDMRYGQIPPIPRGGGGLIGALLYR